MASWIRLIRKQEEMDLRVTMSPDATVINLLSEVAKIAGEKITDMVCFAKEKDVEDAEEDLKEPEKEVKNRCFVSELDQEPITVRMRGCHPGSQSTSQPARKGKLHQ